MGEPRSITYREVAKVADSEFEAKQLWAKIGEISEAGNVPVGDEATIGLTDVSDAKRERIDKLLAKAAVDDEAEPAAETASAGTTTKKRGNQ